MTEAEHQPAAHTLTGALLRMLHKTEVLLNPRARQRGEFEAVWRCWPCGVEALGLLFLLLQSLRP